MKTNNMMTIASVYETKNYDAFEMHELNRPIHKNDTVEASMRRVGFMSSSPIQCAKAKGGKLKIIRGHHRFAIAKKLGIPVKYMIDESNVDIFELEGSSTSAWNASDFAVARARGGDPDMQFLLDFKQRHGLTLGSAASLVYGESAGSGNAVATIKTGKFRAGDMEHANMVVKVTDLLFESGIQFARSSGFVSALSHVLRIPEIDYNVLVHRATVNGHVLTKRGSSKEYLFEIEALYNYQAKGKRFPVAFRAQEVQKQRKSNFGRQSK